MTADKYQFSIIEIPVGKFKFKISQLKNPEILFDELLKKDNNHPDIVDERIPYWSELWPSAIALSEYMSDKPLVIKGKKVTEIGCGLGLPGIVAGKLGGDVTLTDYLPEALEQAKQNWKLNFKTEANVQLLDWRTPGKILPADILLASDIAYESKSFKPIIKSLKLLIKKDGIILISEPNRKFTKDFFIELKNNGFEIMKEDRKVLKDGIKYTISIYQLKY